MSDEYTHIISRDGTLQPLCVATINPYQYFGLDTRFDIDLQQLELAYLRVQALVHPDNHVNMGEASATNAINHTIYCNDSYQQLLDPFTRGKILLRLVNYDYGDDDKAVQPAKTFLLEIMELEADLATNKPLIADKFKQCCADIAQAFSAGDYSRMSTRLTEVQYYARLLQL
jgi:DnaJ-domain-containing protein 1